MLLLVLSVGLIVAVTVAAFFDLLTRRIPNWLTLSAVGVALVLRGMVGAEAFGAGLLGAAVAFLLVLPLFALRGIGGGDAKLLIMVGAFLGTKGLLVALLATGVVGGVMSMIAAIRGGIVLPALYNTGGLVKWVFTLGRRGERTSLVSPGAVSVPYGVAIAAGTLVALYLGGGVS